MATTVSGGELKYFYFVTVLKYISQVSVLYWSIFILGNFYFTTFQVIILYFLLHYISEKHVLPRYFELEKSSRTKRRDRAVRFLNELILFNKPVKSFANHTE